MKKTRLDLFLVEKGLSISLEKAKKEILAGWVTVNGERIRKASAKINGSEVIKVEHPKGSYVSRGGEKLKHGLDYFGIDLKGRRALDLGASTGGFTDCMLKSGALLVYAVDVGFNQIDYSLRTDDRVVVMEKTHARDIKKEMFPQEFDFFTADLSFISILNILPSVINIKNNIEGIVLLKPQFEALPEEHEKGVVRSPSAHEEILKRVLNGIVETGFYVKGLTWSPIKGPAGNMEFLLWISSSLDKTGDFIPDVRDIVANAHEALNKN